VFRYESKLGREDLGARMLAMKSIMRIAILGFACLLFGNWQRAAVFAAEKDKAPPPPEVTVVRAGTQWFRDDVHVTGYLVARKQSIVALPPNYKLSEVQVREGGQVKSGEALARMTLQALSAPGQGSASGQNSPIEKTVEAPDAGTVMRAPTTEEPFFLIAVDNEIEFEAEVASIYAPKIAPGQDARVTTEKGHEIIGKVRAAPESVDPKQLSRARIEFTEKDPVLRIGMFVRGTITVDRRQGISISSSAISHTTEGSMVQVVHDNAIENKFVVTGLNTDTNTEIRTGIKVDDLVVVNAGSSLRPGMKVKPIESGSSMELN
jgi:multidrug efflux pump subunit AcrA (membrane-fusion protein)